jgi:AcrR family transcriptional regulator
LTQVERREDTRTRLLAAAREVFLERGYHGATLERVAATAGYTKGAVYARFSDKADLFLTLLANRLDANIPDLLALAESGEVEEAIRALMRLRTNRPHADIEWSRVVLEFRVHAARDPALNARFAAVYEKLRGGLTEIIGGLLARAGVERPRIPADALARVILALANGGLLEQFIDGDAFPQTAFEEVSLAVFREAQAGSRQTAPAGSRNRRLRRPSAGRRGS